MHVEVIATEDLGDRSYLVHDGIAAIVVDPQRDIDRVEKALAEHGLSCAMVLETHIHNDYVTGGYDLARRNGCPYVINAEDTVSFDRLGVADGDEPAAGSMTVRVVATPGHTDTHLSYVVADDSGDPPAVFRRVRRPGRRRPAHVDSHRSRRTARVGHRNRRGP